MSSALERFLQAFALCALSAAAFAQNADQQSPSSQQPKQLQTIVVTGSAVPRTDLETPSPVTVLTAADIKRSGLTTVADVVRSISADNSGTIPTAFTAGFAAGSSGVALRGLTVNSTLVLVDGMRQANYPLADDGQRSFVDLNTIPLSAVDRIEVLKDGASSIYGADAIAGVVNIILKHDYQGNEITAEVGDSQHGGGFEKRATGLFGHGDLANDHYNAYVSFEYQGDNRIRVNQRGFPFNTPDLSSIGGFNSIGGQPAAGSGSIYGSVTPAKLANPPDITTGYPVDPLTGLATNNPVFQPLRPCGPGSTDVNDPNNNLGGGAGEYCTQNFQSQYGDIQPAQERFGLLGRVTVRINDSTEAYLEASYYQNEVKTDGAPPQIQTGTPNNTNTIVLPARLADGSLNPNDPFAGQGYDALINYAFGDVRGGSDLKNHVARMVAGIRGMFGDWNWNADVNLNHAWLHTANFGFLNYAQLLSDINDGSYSFVNPASNSPGVIAALAPPLVKTSTTDMDSLDIGVTRDLWQLPGGPLGLALGGQWRHEAQDDPDLNPNLAAQGLGIAHTIGSRNVAAVYGEVDAPLLKSLEVDLSARYDHYSDFGGAFDPKFGIKWTPIKQLAIRGTYSRGFRAPGFAENGSSGVEGFITETLPNDFRAAHGNDGYTLPYALGLESVGNPNIKPERATNWTFGAIFQPTQWFSATADYYAIKKTNLIIAGPLSAAALDAYFANPQNPQLPPGYTITLDRPDPAFPNEPPRPLVVNSPYANANELKTSGVDIDLRGNFSLGPSAHLVSDFSATKIFTWKQINSDGSVYQFVGTEGPYILSSGAGTPRYRATWANTLTWGPWAVTGTIYYVSALRMSAPDVTGDNSCFSNDPNGNPFPPSCRMASFTDTDLTASYQITPNIQINGGILNLFDRKPPFDPINYAGLNYNPTYAQAGIVGRFFKLGVDVKF